MVGTVQWMSRARLLGRSAIFVALISSVTACASVQNMIPDPGNFRLPDRSTFLPTTSNSYAYPLSSTAAVGPADLVDAQGQCAGAATATASPRGVALDMTECEVVRSLGQPQSVEFPSQAGGQRRTVMTYRTGERPGVYEFAGGRLTGVERGDEQAPAVAKKPAAKKPRPPA
jgi:hypothetical protein